MHRIGGSGVGTLIVGMHRSGTSLATSLLVAAGGRLCRADDVMGAAPDNPGGFFESRSLADFDELLLSGCGGSWLAPPALDAPWLADRLDHRVDEARERFEAVHERAGWVWKDPRLCLLLPFWRRVLEGPLAAVLVWRHPDEVADSLVRRDGLDPGHARRLWTHYVLRSLEGCRGLPTHVVRYDDVLDDPSGFADSAGGFLARHGVLEPRALPPGAAAELARSELRHHERAETDDPLAGYLAALGGSHDDLDPPPPPDVEPHAEVARVWPDGLVVELGRRDARIAELETELARRVHESGSEHRGTARSWWRRR